MYQSGNECFSCKAVSELSGEESGAGSAEYGLAPEGCNIENRLIYFGKEPADNQTVHYIFDFVHSEDDDGQFDCGDLSCKAEEG